MPTDALIMVDLLGPEEVAEVVKATQNSLETPGAFVPVPTSTYRKLEGVVERHFQPVLEAVREAERMPSLESFKLRVR